MITFGIMENGIKMVIDVGNTRTKVALFKDDTLLIAEAVKGSFLSLLNKMILSHGLPSSCIVSKVSMKDEELIAALEPVKASKLILFRSGMVLPVKIMYKTPETLGNDRLANACGAWKLYQNRNSLVIDVGTCIKYDFLSSHGNYMGGSISPGLIMRYKALARFTSQLPYYKPVDQFPELIGQSTEGAMRSGVENGMLAELNEIIVRYQELFDQTQIIITGGDHKRFADKLKSPIFVAPDLTLTGLKVILDHNDQ